MILICDATGKNPTRLHHIQSQLPESEILNITPVHDDILIQLNHCGLCIEQHVLDSTTIIADSRYRSVIVLIGSNNDSMDNLQQYLSIIRTDELIFPSQTASHECSWVAGHVQSVVKLAACAMTLHKFTWPVLVNVGWGNPFGNITPCTSNNLMHLAKRLNFKVGSLTL